MGWHMVGRIGERPRRSRRREWARLPERVVSRTLDLLPGGTGTWKDSTLSALLCSPPTADGTTLCNASGSATVTWLALGDSLVVLRNQSTTVGYVVSSKKFFKQPDGTLIRNADSQTEIYRRR